MNLAVLSNFWADEGFLVAVIVAGLIAMWICRDRD